MCLYLYVQILNDDWPLQHAHIENIKSVANLPNKKDVFMCILRFHARAGYLQHYKALLKELNNQALVFNHKIDRYLTQTQADFQPRFPAEISCDQEACIISKRRLFAS